jgi:hypothetical protein
MGRTAKHRRRHDYPPASSCLAMMTFCTSDAPS